jgi:hypothetical protein
MIFSDTAGRSAHDSRDKALVSAVLLRDCSLLPHTSLATRRACRVVMREQAIRWRLPVTANIASARNL